MNKMKTTKAMILTVLIAASALLMSCSKDDDNNDPSIVGTWLTISGKYETFKNGEFLNSSTNTIDDKNYTRITFNSNSTFSYFDSTTYTDSNGEEAVESGTETGTYTVKDNILLLTFEGDTDIESYEFTLSANKLIIVYTEEGTNSDNDTMKYLTTTTLARQ